MTKARVRSSLAAIANTKHLRNAWVDINLGKRAHSRRVPGADGRSLESYAQALDDNLSILAQRLLRGGYSYNHLLPHFEQKSNGKYRVICVPTVSDRIVQRALLNYLLTHNSGRYAFASEISYGFIKNRGVAKAIQEAKRQRTVNPWAYKADIASFFDGIHREQMKDAIKRKIRLPSVLPLLLAACDCEAKPQTKADAKRLQALEIKSGQGLRQGMPLSPYFSNIYLEDFDKQMMHAKANMVRYADDFVAFAESEQECRNIDAMCREALSKLGLDIHQLGTKDKCEIRAPNEAVEFLGIELTPRNGSYSYRISDQQINRKKQELFQLGDLNHLIENRLTVTKFAQRISAKIDGWLAAYEHCENIDSLADKLTNWRTSVFEQIFISGIGVPAANFNRRIRQFLEILPPPKKSNQRSRG